MVNDVISRKAAHDMVRRLTKWRVTRLDGASQTGLMYDDVQFGLDKLPAVDASRVMTLSEALKADYVYLEIKLHASLPCECCILAVDPDGGILPLHKGFCAYLDGEEYGETWRCWTQRPTEEQREAEAWQQSLT